MTQQTEAQRLAELLDTDGWPDAAAELRRLNAELERKSDAIQRLWKERDTLQAVSKQLLEALQALIALQDKVDPEGLFCSLEWLQARAAIAAAKGEA